MSRKKTNSHPGLLPGAKEISAPATVIEDVKPQVDGGRFAVKRVVGEEVVVTAACFAHGHERVACALRFRGPGDKAWREVAMAALGNDLWSAAFAVDRIGAWEYSVACWVDPLSAWRDGFARRIDADDMRLAARMGAELIGRSAANCRAEDRARLEAWTRVLREQDDVERLRIAALDAELFALARAHEPRGALTETRPLAVAVDRERARFSTWYELFPRSAGNEPGVHGTFADVGRRLDEIAAMGFDVLYLPPIHPIGRANRKGRNNATTAAPDDVGSPWAIGAKEGGHTAILPALGTAADFRHLVMAARARGMEIALDIAFQCAPDHPWVKQHPDWFRKRPDGTIQYAENPPKKYQDIYPLDFDSADAKGLWEALRAVFLFWAKEGVAIFRVDNPHTKPFAFWEWVIKEVKGAYPEALFLSEAFTRPHVMHQLAKRGFTQSYTYFTWRLTKAELTEYFTELAHDDSREYFLPNCWPNTPDILPVHLHDASPAAFRLRLVLAATLAANYGMYGPAYELGENLPREPGSEEYLNSEKYELRYWDRASATSLAALVTELNAARHAHPALQSDWSLAFHPTDSDGLLCYSKRNGDDRVLAVVNLDPDNVLSGWVDVDCAALGIDSGAALTMRDLLSGATYSWRAGRNFVRLDPAAAPAHLFVIT